MRVLFLADASSIHTIRWTTSLSLRGIEIQIVSLAKSNYNYDNNIVIHSFGLDRSKTDSTEDDLSKIKYLRYIRPLKTIIKKFKPDLIHCHYASSYGLLGALSRFHPLIISVWGTDVFQFPLKSRFHKLLIKFNFSRADVILSTSRAMAAETSKYTNKNIEITPFGIDIERFRNYRDQKPKNKIVIGTIKTMYKHYGIDTLIKTFNLLINKFKDPSLELLIVGGGSQYEELKLLVDSLGITSYVTFTGQIEGVDIPEYLNKIDIYVALSNFESFGVGILEASACEIPVVVSNVGGLPEVVENGQTGLIVSKNNPVEAACAIEKLILNKDLRIRMGQAGRERVKSLYNWSDNVELMLSIYNRLLNEN